MCKTCYQITRMSAHPWEAYKVVQLFCVCWLSYLLKYGGFGTLFHLHSDSNITLQSQSDHVATTNRFPFTLFSSNQTSCIWRAFPSGTPLSTYNQQWHSEVLGKKKSSWMRNSLPPTSSFRRVHNLLNALTLAHGHGCRIQQSIWTNLQKVCDDVNHTYVFQVLTYFNSYTAIWNV